MCIESSCVALQGLGLGYGESYDYAQMMPLRANGCICDFIMVHCK